MIFSDFVSSPFIIEVWLGNAVLEGYQLHTPIPFVYTQFMEMASRIAKDKRPMKVKCSGVYTIKHPNGDTEDKPAKVVFYNATYESEIGIDE